MNILKHFKEPSFKEIEYKNNNVIIIHYLYKEYKYITRNDSVLYPYEKFKNKIIQSYNFGKEFNLNKILNIQNDCIITEMQKYKILLDNLHLFNIDSLKNLIKIMYENKIWHDDFAFRNIGIDKNGKYHLTDLSSLTKDNVFVIKINKYNKIVIGHNGYLYYDLKKYGYKDHIQN